MQQHEVDFLDIGAIVTWHSDDVISGEILEAILPA